MARKQMTLCIVQKDKRVLLGMKKRGFGAGLWNGFGGKVSAEESIEAAAVREVQEEAGITPLLLAKRGVLDFEFQNDSDVLEVHIFKCSAYEGEVGESEEMRPQWFSIDAVPFEQMWKDDEFWFELLLQDKNFTGKFIFNADSEIVTNDLREVEVLP